MPYVYTAAYYDAFLKPQPNETYEAFVTRCTGAMMTLEPGMTQEEALELCLRAWGHYLFGSAKEMTVTLKRELYGANGIYFEPWWGDWTIAEIHSAVLPTITYSAVEKARAGSGDSFRIQKSVEDKQLVFGWANVAKDANGQYPLDWDGDVTEPEELEQAAYTFVLKYRETGEQHQGEAKGYLVESMMFTKEKQEVLGIPPGILPEAWWVGFYLPDKEVFQKVKSGEYEMFSVQGVGKRVPTGQ